MNKVCRGEGASGPEMAGFGDRFLVSSANFPCPEGPALEGLGGGATIDFAGGPYLVQGLNPLHAEVAAETWGALWTSQECFSPSVSVEVRSVDEAIFRTVDVRNWNNSFDFDYRPDEVRVAGLGGLAHLELRPTLSRCCFWIPEELDAERFAGVFENLMRVVMAYRLLDLEGVLLHSSGVVDREGAHLFYGHSGVGKSTLASISASTGRAVLSDDINVLIPDQRRGNRRSSTGPGSWWTERLPFAGDFRTPVERRHRCRVVGVWSLEQAAEPAALELTAARALASLLASTPFVNRDPHRAEELERCLLQVVAAFPVFRLRFAKDASFWRVVREVGGMNGERI